MYFLEQFLHELELHGGTINPSFSFSNVLHDGINLNLEAEPDDNNDELLGSDSAAGAEPRRAVPHADFSSPSHRDRQPDGGEAYK